VGALFASSEELQCSGTAREIMQSPAFLAVTNREAEAGQMQRKVAGNDAGTTFKEPVPPETGKL